MKHRHTLAPAQTIDTAFDRFVWRTLVTSGLDETHDPCDIPRVTLDEMLETMLRLWAVEPGAQERICKRGASSFGDELAHLASIKLREGNTGKLFA